MRRREHQSGFGATVILLAILVVAALAGAGLVVYQHHKPTNAKSTTAATTPTQITTRPSNTSTTQPATPTQYTGMTQYTNAKYGFSFYYPSTWRVEQDSSASSVDAQNTELVMWLVDTSVTTTTTTNNKTVYIEVSSRDLASKTASFDGSIDGEGGKSADYKQQQTLKSKNIVKYTIPQSATVNRVMYFFPVGAKTFSIQTFDEETNLARTSDYMTKFNNVVDSLAFTK